MKYVYAIPGESGQVISTLLQSSIPDGHILMSGERPGPDYIAQADGTWIQHTPVPEEITNAQGHAILIQKGVYQDVLDYIANIADLTQKALAEVAFNRTQTWRRNSPFLIQAATDLGFLDQLDDWFIEGAQIQL